jgi:hypothetical protein
MTSLLFAPVQPKPSVRTFACLCSGNKHLTHAYTHRKAFVTNSAASFCRRTVVTRAASEDIMLSDIPEPEDARGAITLGLKFSDAGQYEQALELFLKALKLPGTGVKRFRYEPHLSIFRRQP